MTSIPESMLFVATVGSTLEPIVTSLNYWRPARARFIVSHETKHLVPGIVEQADLSLGPGAYDTTVIPDAQQLIPCVLAMSRVEEEVQAWTGRGEEYQVIVDHTGGTKTMSAALVLVAHRWKCRFSYVGGEPRTKEGLGVVKSGTESVLESVNPWDALGYRGIQDACAAFDDGNYVLAVTVARRWRNAVADDGLKRSFATLSALVTTYEYWDRFDHHRASVQLNQVRRNASDLQTLFGPARTEQLLALVERHTNELKALEKTAAPTDALVLDLLANARRRADEGRYDDAVARLYRAIEATAQVQLAVAHEITDTAHVLLTAVPEPLRQKWSAREKDGALLLGLQDAYLLLNTKGDAKGKRFFSLELDKPKSPLSARNQSILAHGFQPINRPGFDALWDKVLELCEVTADDLSIFPVLGPNVASP